MKPSHQSAPMMKTGFAIPFTPLFPAFFLKYLTVP